MRILLVAFLLVYSTTVFGQVVRTQQSMSGEEYKKWRASIEPTDHIIYDMSGNVIDSATAKKMAKTFEYEIGLQKRAGESEYKYIIRKVNLAKKEQEDEARLPNYRPKSEKLAQGITLDLSPLAKRTDLSKLEGKAVVLIFWKPQYGGMFTPVYQVIDDFMDGNKFDVFAITDLSYDAARDFLKKYPINGHQILEAPSITDYYGIDNEPVIVVTNAQHQITYAIKGSVAVIPRMLHKAFKEL
jgi:hypothetical protein